MNSSVTVAIIAAASGIMGTLLSVKYKDYVAKKSTPKDRIELVFEGYDNLLKQQQEDIGRKEEHIKQLQALTDELKKQLESSQAMIDELRDDLDRAKYKNHRLEDELASLRKDYNADKKRGSV